MLVFGMKGFSFFRLPPRLLAISCGGPAVLHFLPVLVMCGTGQGVYTPYDLYFRTPAPELSMQKLGMLTSMRLDLKRLVFGFPSESDDGEPPLKDSTAQNEPEESEPPVVPVDVPIYKPNIIDIDFDRLTDNEKDKTLHENAPVLS